MALYYDRVRMTTATTGTGTITLGSAVTGYQSFAGAGVPNATVVAYGIEDGSSAWEVGTGTYTTSGTTLTRVVSSSSNGGAAINLSGSAQVFITARAADISNAATAYSVGGTDVAIADGGTGASTASAAFTNLKQAASDTATGVVELATAAEVATGTDTARVPSVSTMGSHQGMAKAWVNFNGTGTVAIRDSFNVSSITDNGTGRYSVNFSTAMANANYAAVVSVSRGSSNNDILANIQWNGTYSTTVLDIGVQNASNPTAGTGGDAGIVNVVVFGD